MCIALVSTAHPLYPLILIDNRDEFLTRPTSNADWWDPPNSHVLGAQDLLREAHGTWMGMTKQGRIAVLTNFREEGQAPYRGARSRGCMVNSFLKVPPDSNETTNDFIKRIVECDGEKGVGGFSLVCGKVGEPLAVISNRTPRVDDVVWIAKTKNETVGLSNAAFEEHSWPKILDGERLMKDAIRASVEQNETEDQLIQRFLDVLSTDTLPKRKIGESWESYIMQLQESIFVPPIEGPGTLGKDADKIRAVRDSEPVKLVNGLHKRDKDFGLTGMYGTQMQTIILVDHNGRARYFERTLFDPNACPIEKGEGDCDFTFPIEGWKSTPLVVTKA
ncbi:MAG: hypothetical protein M1834_006658 [Cirrosporium novae-zelandiae]|nr:MAG: hypothetical protein M1834_006658 [Cirrosporium novae-zelandiae]